MDWTAVIVGVITTLLGGGLGALATVNSIRKKGEFEVWEAQLDEMKDELSFERSRNHELMEMNIAKESRFVEQTNRLRETQDRELKSNERIIDLTKKLGEADVELALVRCEDHLCPWRKPPNSHTPAPPDISKDEWHMKRKNKES